MCTYAGEHEKYGRLSWQLTVVSWSICFCIFRVDGVHAIIVADRDGVPVLQGCYILTAFFLFFYFCHYYFITILCLLKIYARRSLVVTCLLSQLKYCLAAVNDLTDPPDYSMDICSVLQYVTNVYWIKIIFNTGWVFSAWKLYSAKCRYGAISRHLCVAWLELVNVKVLTANAECHCKKDWALLCLIQFNWFSSIRNNLQCALKTLHSCRLSCQVHNICCWWTLREWLVINARCRMQEI